MRVVSACIVYKAREKIKGMRWDVDERDAQLLKKMRGRAKKHPKVILRHTAGGSVKKELEADHKILRELGINLKANLEYDTPRQRQHAAHEDDFDMKWGEELEREYYGARSGYQR